MDNLLVTIVKRKITVTMFVVAAVGFGIASFRNLKYELMPKKESNILSIITRYPGNSPSRIEELITKPIEKQIVGVGGVEKILSSSEEGESKITIFFNTQEPLKYKSVELKSKVELIRYNFPREVEEPYVVRFNPEDKPVFTIRLTSKLLSLKELREISEKKLKTILERVPGVGEVIVIGGRYREIRVDVDKGRLLSTGLTPNQVMDEIRNINRDIYLGKLINSPEIESELRLKNRIESIQDLRNINFVVGKSRKVVRITDVSDIYDGERDLSDLSREKGFENVSIQIKKNSSANILEVCKLLEQEVSNFEYPNISFDIAYNQSKYISAALDSVSMSGLVGALACSIIVFLFLKDLRYTIIISITIPIAVVLSFVILDSLQKSLNIMTLAGLALGVGVLIDSSIVVIERINSNISKGIVDPIFISIDELWKELLASSLTNIIVFIPLLYASADFKNNFLDLATSITACILIAYFLSLIFVPMLCSVVPNEWNFVKADIVKIRIDYSKFIASIKKRYEFLSSLSIKQISPKIIVLVTIIFFGFVFMFFVRKEYIDFAGSREIVGSVELPTGTNLEATSKSVKLIEELISKNPFVEKVSTKVEKWHADLSIKLKKDLNGNSPEDIKKQLRNTTDDIKGVFVYYIDANAFGSNKELDIDIIGDDLEELKKLSREIAESIKELKETDQVVFRFREGKEELQLNLRQDKVALAGLTNQFISDFARTALQGSIPTKIFDRDREVDIRVRFRADDRKSVDDLTYSLIPVNDSKVSLIDLLEIKRTKADTRINRKNKRRMVTITANFKDTSLSEYAEKAEAKLKAFTFPQNYYYDLGDAVKKLRKNQIEMFGFILFAIGLIYGTLAILFQSLKISFPIMLMVPINISATTFFLFIFGQTYNVSTYIGFILLAGLSINNSIMIIENAIRNEDNIPFPEKMRIAVINRKRAMRMTTLTTIFALIPGIFGSSEGSEFWRPMSLAVIFGMSFSYVSAIEIFPSLANFFINSKLLIPRLTIRKSV
ncbi:efflux RND transporter permease subunit [Leptospira bandrabouensis]|uniref:efflux RND transporter permease subunit n=1 Tax=Leptospira bandrabouensis TaxID=2484903 RepID=UPI00223D85DC|nr:efflux RND transporter permease subunit [Leptospira bandrabouensis]MCW7459810.1 efflux RND transporter permease subunit [Leptospira bandrabouensis]MCW7479279.1 efflux RND transporter permease subunit [Leptospira bandrabouensis]MCW7486926.1 efflux RND transporter permease subunit [Leptospira bandrabouensis]